MRVIALLLSLSTVAVASSLGLIPTPSGKRIVKRQVPGGGALGGLGALMNYDRLNDNYQNLLQVGVSRSLRTCGYAMVGQELEPCDCIRPTLGMRHGRLGLMIHCLMTGGGVPPVGRPSIGNNMCPRGQFCCCDLRDHRGLSGVAAAMARRRG